MNQVKDNGKRHGYWSSQFTDGTPAYKCFYNDGEEVGYEEMYYSSGPLSSKKYHISSKKYHMI